MIYDKLEVQNCHLQRLLLVKTTFPKNSVVAERPTTSFPPALHVTDNYACGLCASITNKLILVFVVGLKSKTRYCV